jgi:hypothetical protein
MTRHKAFCTIAFGLLSLLCLTGCPWSSSANVFEGTKGISMPDLNGPPAQTEPPVAEDFSASDSSFSDGEFE